MKSIIISTFSAWMVRILAILLNIAGLPLALHELGPSRFSLFLVVLSIGSWIGFANIGMGRVIANIISRYSHHTGSSVQRFISTAIIIGGGFNVALFFIVSTTFLTLMSYMSLSAVIADNYSEFVVSILSLFFAFCLWFFLSIFEGIDAGNNQLHRLYLFQLPSYGISILLLFYLFPRYPSIPLAAYILNLSFLCGCIAHAVDVIRRNRALFLWRFEWRLYVVKALLLNSLDFTVIGIGIGVLFQLSTGLIGLAADPREIIELGIFMRLMQSYGALIIAFTFPLTSFIASKIAKRETHSALQTMVMSGAILLTGAIFASAAFCMFANEALALWLKSGVQFNSGFIKAGTILIIVCACHFFLAALLIAGYDTKHVARLHFAEAIIFVPLTYFMFRTNGQTGVLAGLDIVMMAGCAWMILRLWFHPIFKQLTKFHNRRNTRLVENHPDKNDWYGADSLHNRKTATH